MGFPCGGLHSSPPNAATKAFHPSPPPGHPIQVHCKGIPFKAAPCHHKGIPSKSATRASHPSLPQGHSIQGRPMPPQGHLGWDALEADLDGIPLWRITFKSTQCRHKGIPSKSATRASHPSLPQGHSIQGHPMPPQGHLGWGALEADLDGILLWRHGADVDGIPLWRHGATWGSMGWHAFPADCLQPTRLYCIIFYH